MYYKMLAKIIYTIDILATFFEMNDNGLTGYKELEIVSISEVTMSS